MAANFGRLKIWVAEVLDYAALNAEFDNILNNLGPAGIGGYSANLAQMQMVTDPNPSGNPSLPNSLAGELERLRFQILAILGTDADYWYDDPTVTLSQLQDLVSNGGVPASRIDSGAEGTPDGYMENIRPQNGVTPTAIVAPIFPITYYINNALYTSGTNIVVSGFSAAPTTGNTCLVNDSVLADQAITTTLGENGTFIPVDTAGIEITTRTNTLQGFKMGAEYFMGEYSVDPDYGPCIFKAKRNNFTDYQFLPFTLEPITDNDTITLCKLAWLYITTSGTVTAGYTAPTYSAAQPATPAIGDFWFELGTTTWKTYTFSGWTDAQATLLGMVIIDGANVVGARSTDSFKVLSVQNTVDFETDNSDNTKLRIKDINSSISVYGTTLNFGTRSVGWSFSGALAANTVYYAYIGNDGTFQLNTTPPQDRRGDFGGYYHPFTAWRCVGYAGTNSSATFASLGNSTENLSVAFSRTGEKNYFANVMPEAQGLDTYDLRATVASNTLNLGVRQAGGILYPTRTNPVVLKFRTLGLEMGGQILRPLVGPKTFSVSNGSTLGTVATVASYLYAYAIYTTATGIELAISGTSFDEAGSYSTTAEGGAGAADLGTVIYSTTARSAARINTLARILITETTAGTWATAPTEVMTVNPVPMLIPPKATVITTLGAGNYTVGPTARYLRVRMVGGGGGGAGEGTTAGTNAGAGGNGTASTFGSSLLTASPGTGTNSVVGTVGGTASVLFPAVPVITLQGGNGNTSAFQPGAGVVFVGAMGGSSFFGGPGRGGGVGTVNGGAAVANQGSGGGAGFVSGNLFYAGASGSGGAYLEALVPCVPGQVFPYFVGSGGTAGTAGAGATSTGGAGGSGRIAVEEY